MRIDANVLKVNCRSSLPKRRGDTARPISLERMRESQGFSPFEARSSGADLLPRASFRRGDGFLVDCFGGFKMKAAPDLNRDCHGP